MEYNIVEFLPAKETAVVPSSWIEKGEGRNQCFWPPFRSTDKINAAVRNASTPDATWDIYDCRILGYAGN